MFNDYDSFIISFDLQCILKAFCVMLFDIFMPLVWYIIKEIKIKFPWILQNILRGREMLF